MIAIDQNAGPCHNFLVDKLSFPSPACFDHLHEIESYAFQCLAAAGLGEWSFRWDRAKRRLGSCRYLKQEITLSRHFVAHNMDRPDQIRDTVLHEIAHALAYLRHGERGHGPFWKRYCEMAGAFPRASALPDMVGNAPYRYLVKLRDTGEVVGSYYRKPRFARYISRTMLRGRPDTLGLLELVELE